MNDNTKILEVRQQILQKIDLGSILESVKPQTLAGDNYVKALATFINEGKANSITSISNIATQCLNQFKNDVSIYGIGETLVEKLNENLDPMIVFCFESIQGKLENNPLAKQLNEKLESLIVMESSKDKASAIRSGLLNPYKVVSESVGYLQSSVSIKTKESNVTTIHEAYTPIIYIENINENAYAKLGNSVFILGDDKLTKTVSPTPKFSFMSSIVEELTWDEKETAFVYNESSLGKFLIKENQIDRVLDDKTTVFEHDTEFVKHMSLITESFENKQNQIVTNKMFDSLLSVKNNFDNFVMADNIIMVENKQNFEKYALVVMENASFVCTLQSVRYPNIVEKFDRIDSALETLKKKSGYSADGFVTEKLKELDTVDTNKKLIVENYTEILESLVDKEQEILAAMEIARSCNQVLKLAKLNESLILVRGHITEQRNNFGEVYNSGKI